MGHIGVYAGSFDPVTVGHEDVIRRAAKLCDKLLVTVMYNPNKKGLFTVAERLELLDKVTCGIPNVEIDAWDGLLVDYVGKMGADYVIRGLRSSADFESEATMAQINARLKPGLETLFLLSKPEHVCVSSSAVREAALFNADYSSFLPSAVIADVKAYFDNHRKER